MEKEKSDYNLEIPKIVEAIKKQKPRRVLLQFPEGLKPRATQTVSEIKNQLGKNNKTEILIWLDSCFGACDIPLEVERLGIDLIVQFGHSAWNFKKKIKVVK